MRRSSVTYLGFFFLAAICVAGCHHKNKAAPAVNSAPTFTSSDAITTGEGGTSTGYQAMATDADSADTLTFSISGGADQSLFEIAPSTGMLSFLAASDFANPLDSNADNAYEVQLKVSDGNGGEDTLALVVTVVQTGLTLEVTFPTPNANLGGGVTTTTVAGNIVDAGGQPITPADINYIDINGVLATLDAGDASRWSAQVPVTEGDNTLVISFQRSSGVITTSNLDITNLAVLSGLEDLILDSANDRVLATDGFIDGLVSIDLASGARTVISDASAGAGTNFSSPRSMAHDSANNRVLVADWTRDALTAVDLATGARSDISSPAVGTGIDLDGPQSVALDSANNRALVAATIDEVIIAVDLSTGNRTELSGPTAGTGPALTDLRDIEIDSANNRALVIDDNAIVAVDLATGNRTIISDAGTGSGPALSSPESFTLDSANNRLLVAILGGSLVSIDLATGDRTLVAETDTDYGLNGTRFTGVAYDGANSRALVTDSLVDAIFAFDLPGGSRSVVFDSSTGTGIPHLNLFGVNGIAMDSQGKRVLVSHWNAKSLVGVSTEGGNRAVLSSDGSVTPAIGSGPAVDFPQKLVLDDTNDRVLILDQNLTGVLSIDLASGDRTIVSSNSGAGTGPAFSSPQDIALDLANNRVLVTDPGAGLLAVDLASGDRTTISDSVTGSGPVFSAPASLALDAGNNRALVLDWNLDMLLAVDLTTGNRTVLSDNAGMGTGAHFSIPFDMEFDSTNNRVIATDYGGGAYKLMAISLANGDRTELSGVTAGSGVLFRNPYYVLLDSANNRAFVYDIAVTAIIVVELSNGERAVMSK